MAIFLVPSEVKEYKVVSTGNGTEPVQEWHFDTREEAQHWIDEVLKR